MFFFSFEKREYENIFRFTVEGVSELFRAEILFPSLIDFDALRELIFCLE